MPTDDYANSPNMSRSEEIIQSILDGTEYDEPARSRIEYLLKELKAAIEGGGGGGGVTSYAPLTEKPKIDNHTLQAGNNTSSDLGLQTKLTFDSAPMESSTKPVTSGGVYTALGTKANSADVYNKSAVDTALGNKADKSTTYTKTEVDTALGSKQNTISDLSTIRSGAALGATAVQPIVGKGLSTNDYTTAEKTKLAGIEAQANKTVVDSTLSDSSDNPVQNKVVKNALDNKQDSLTTAQFAAVNSGIDTTKVDQIETNKSNISSVQEQANWNSNNSVKNICPYNSGATSVGEGTIWNNLPIDIAAGTYSVSFSTDSGNSALVLLATDGVTEVLRKTYSTTTVNDTFTISMAAKYIRLYIGASKTVSNFMIRPNFTDSTYQPYAMSNAELTQSVEPIPRLVDAGAKNKLLIGTPTSVPTGLTCVRNSDGTYTVSGTLAAANSISFNIDAIPGNLVLSGCPEGGGNDTYLLRITKSGSQVTGSVDTGNGSDVFTMDGTGYALNLRFAAGTYTNVIFKPMICLKPLYDAAHSYQPYAKSNSELTALLAEDRASLVEFVDEGAKNKLPITVSSQVVGEAVFTVNTDNSISVYTTATTTALRSITLVQATDNFYVYSTDIVSGVPSTDKDVVIQFGIGTSGNIKNVEPSVGYIAAGASGYIRYMQIIIRSGVSIPQTEPLIFKPMICSKAAWDISQSYQPYRPSYQELYEMVLALQSP